MRLQSNTKVVQTQDGPSFRRISKSYWVIAAMVLANAFLVSELTRARHENSMLNHDVSLAGERLKSLERTLDMIGEYTSQLDDLTSATLGRHGPRPPAPIWAEIDENTESQSRILVARIASLDLDTTTMERRLRGLAALAKYRPELLSAMPSISPTSGWINSGFGKRQSPFTGKTTVHKGLDVGAEIGTPIVATAEGTVALATFSPSFGKVVVLDHGFGFMTRYAHAQELMVRQGQRIRRGQVIAKMGSTGRSTGSHLHYEVLVDREPVNPREFILDVPRSGRLLAGVASVALQQSLAASRMSARTDGIGGEDDGQDLEANLMVDSKSARPTIDATIAADVEEASPVAAQTSRTVAVAVLLLTSTLGLVPAVSWLRSRQRKRSTGAGPRGLRASR